VSGSQTGKSAKLAVVFGAVSVWNIYDIMTTTEVQSQAVMTLQYLFLAGTLLGLVMSLLRLVTSK
jgi:hypothetical protein